MIIRQRPDVMIAIPACDEEDRIARCLSSVVAAIATARSDDLIDAVVVAVAAHRCQDRTAQVARALLARSDVDAHVLVVTEPASVRAVRTRLVHSALRSGAGRPTWLFSTDADTQVPPGWIVDGLALAEQHTADLIIGLVDLDPEDLHPAVIERHEQLVRAGVRADGSHHHVYAANLVVRMQTFLAAGGFPDVDHGEEHALARAVAASGGVIHTTTLLRTRTSARTQGRAAHGLAALLGDLDQQSRSPLAS